MKRSRKPNHNYRPLIDWYYRRRPGDFLSFIDDLWFWGYTHQPIFRSRVYEWTNLSYKAIRSEMIKRKSTRKTQWFKDDGRRSYKYEAGKNSKYLFYREHPYKLDIQSYLKQSRLV